MLQRVRHHSLVPVLMPFLAVLSLQAAVLAQGTPGQATVPPRTASTVPPAGAGLSGVADSRQIRREPDPQLLRILQVWEQSTGKIKRMQGEFVRYEYDRVFRVERRQIGRYYYEAPDQGRMDFAPVSEEEIRKEPQHQVGDITYQVVAGSAESWICNGEELLSIQIGEKTYHKITIPPEFRGEAISDGPLPFLFGLKPDDALRKYDMELGSMHNLQGATPMIHLIAYPLQEAQRREFQRAEMLVNPKNFEPIAVKLYDPAGSKETVYKFQKHDHVTIPWIPGKFRVNLASYKCLNEGKAPPRQETMRVEPGGTIIQ